jgi:predicted nucleic acid-binding protein
MALLFWDASALVKRYTPEVGRETANALFAVAPVRDMATSPWGYVETYSILLRKLNGGTLDLPAFTTAVTALQTEVVASPDFGLLSISDAVIFASVSQMRHHNLNATDAALLTMLLEYTQLSSISGSQCVMIAADQRLVRAAAAEGLRTLNPEFLAASDVPEFVASL